MVTEWLSVFPIAAYICDTVDLLYEEDQPNEKEVLHKEEGLSRRRFDADDRRRVANELCKHSHPLEGRGEDNVLYNIVNDKIAPPAVNVADAVSIGDKMLSVFRKSLPPGFHAKMSSPVNTMEYLKRSVKVGEKTVRCRVYLPAHSDGRTTTTSPTGADILLSSVCSTSIFG